MSRQTPEAIRKANLRSRYGITVEDFDLMVAAQNNKCKICRVDFIKDDKRLMPYVDHDHITKKVRGLLCGFCNIALGHFQDDAKRVGKAAAYLERRK